jgi:hypothetical protein
VTELLRKVTELDRSWLYSIIAELNGAVSSPWAVLLTCFKDDPIQLPAKTLYERLFTSAGAGTLNMVEFFSDVSHGKLDLSGTVVSGWHRLDRPRSDYVGNVYPQPVGKLNRNGLLDAARAQAALDGVVFSKFSGTVVVGYGSTDLCGWVGGMAALCDDNSLQPSLLGQEMGHGYGLDHARRDGSPADYDDPWDVMSTAAWPAEEAPNADYTSVGPALNAWNMRSRDWLDESRVATPSSGHFSVVQLRPLHRHDLSGYLALEAGQYLVEFRVPEKWDAAIDVPRVFVHRFEGNRSYLMSGSNGQWSLGEGDSFEDDSPFNLGARVQVNVQKIDAEARIADIGVSIRPGFRPPDLVAGQMFGGIAVDGGGWFWINGKLGRIPPRGPVTELLKTMAAYLNTEAVGNVRAAAELKQALAQRIVRHGVQMVDEVEIVSEQPPGYATMREPRREG